LARKTPACALQSCLSRLGHPTTVDGVFGRATRRSVRGYDCSGAVSYVLHGAGLRDHPLDSSGLARRGSRGRGAWITVYTNRAHAYIVVAGLRFDTSGRGERGPRWRPEPRSPRRYAARHVEGL
jgi:hypothetical protein